MMKTYKSRAHWLLEVGMAPGRMALREGGAFGHGEVGEVRRTGLYHLVPGPVQKWHLGCFPLLQQQRWVRRGSKIKNTGQSQAGTRVGVGKTDSETTTHRSPPEPCFMW